MVRHPSLADQLTALRSYVTEPDHTPEPVETNWSVVPANDNNPEDVADMHVERHWDMSPSPEEIMKQVKVGPEVRNAAGQIIRIGNLRFSDGTQTETGFKLTIDGKVVSHQFTMPAGAMLGTTDKERAVRGGDDTSMAASNAYFGEPKTDKTVGGLFQAEFSKPRGKAPRTKRTGPKTKAEARQWLADAIANTPVMPVVTKCPDGFPAAPKRLAQLFPGMVKVATGSEGSSAWQDIALKRENRKEWHEWVGGLSTEDGAVLEAAKTARSYGDVGVAAGQTMKYAKYNGGGRRALISANDNLMEAIRKLSA